jgi:hypothetical protein
MKKLLLACFLFGLSLLTACLSANIFENRCADCSLEKNTQYRINYPQGDPRNGTLVTSDEDGCVEYIAVKATDSCSGVSFTKVGKSSAFTASPSSIDLAAPPATVTLSGVGIDATYGMPLIQYYDSTGSLVASALANTVASDGTWLQGNTPDLSNAYNGETNVEVSNRLADGTWSYPVGIAPLTIYGGNDPPPLDDGPPPDPEGCGGQPIDQPQMPCYAY